MKMSDINIYELLRMNLLFLLPLCCFSSANHPHIISIAVFCWIFISIVLFGNCRGGRGIKLQDVLKLKKKTQ